MNVGKNDIMDLEKLMAMKSDGLEKIQTEFVKRDNYQSEDIRWVVKLQSLQKLCTRMIMEVSVVDMRTRKWIPQSVN